MIVDYVKLEIQSNIEVNNGVSTYIFQVLSMRLDLGSNIMLTISGKALPTTVVVGIPLILHCSCLFENSAKLERFFTNASATMHILVVENYWWNESVLVNRYRPYHVSFKDR